MPRKNAISHVLDAFATGRALMPPDAPDSPESDLDIRCRQFVNRWVFLPHQRKAALAELTELIAEAKK